MGRSTPLRNWRIVGLPFRPARRSVIFVSKCRGNIIQVADTNAAVTLLVSGRADAVVYHLPEIHYWTVQHPDTPLLLAPVNEAASQFSFALRHGAPQIDALNIAILQEEETGTLKHIEETMGVPIDPAADIAPPSSGTSSP